MSGPGSKTVGVLFGFTAGVRVLQCLPMATVTFPAGSAAVALNARGDLPAQPHGRLMAAV